MPMPWGGGGHPHPMGLEAPNLSPLPLSALAWGLAAQLLPEVNSPGGGFFWNPTCLRERLRCCNLACFRVCER